MKTRKIRPAFIILTAALLLLLAACESKSPNGAATVQPSGSAAPSGTAKPLKELNVLLDWYPNAVHTFLYAAEEQGYFKEAGLKVNLQVPADTNDAIKLVAAGKADLALSYQLQVAISRSQDIPVVSVASIVRHPLNQLFVAESSGVKSPKDLAGKKVGYPSFALSQAVVETMIAADGGDPKKTSFIDIGFDLIPAMTTRKVDAIIGGYINHEKLLIEKEGMKLTVLDPVKYGVPDNAELVLIAGEDGLKNNREAIQAFWNAARKGQEYTVKNPDAALKILLDKQSKDYPLDADIEKKSLDILLPLMDAGSGNFGAQDEATWKAVIDWLKKTNQIEKDIKPADAFVNLD